MREGGKKGGREGRKGGAMEEVNEGGEGGRALFGKLLQIGSTMPPNSRRQNIGPVE